MGYMNSQLVVVLIIARAEKEVIGAAFCAKMTSCEEITAGFTDFVETNRTLKHPALLF
jgi:hypothetical protein